MPRPSPVVLLILDGWGYREPAADNAISLGQTPNWDRIWDSRPHSFLTTSGEAVGLPDGQMGNSEVGHMNLGAGRVVYQELTRINKAIESGEFAGNAALLEAIEAARSSGGTLHIMGLVSPGGVHSHEKHVLAMLELALADPDLQRVAVHAFLDGRDTPPRSASDSLERLQAATQRDPRADIVSICGRYFAMDRDKRWDRTEKAWRLIAETQAPFEADSAAEGLRQAYERGEDDEFVQPTRIGKGRPIRDGDVVVFMNFRADRARQLTQALFDPEFDGFERRRPDLAALVTLTRYQDDFPCPAAFPPDSLPDLLGEVVAGAGMRQLRIAETEKYAHVTYFFNGGDEKVFAGEDRELIPSPKVATYDLQPQMSAPQLEQKLIAAIGSGQYDLIVCNVANPDMVGHTGKMEAAVSAVETVDRLLGSALKAVDQAGGEMLITADHGNVEQMTDPDTGQSHTAHTLNPVPLIYYGPREPDQMRDGSLRDIAPTLLALLDLPQPEAMTGQALFDVAA